VKLDTVDILTLSGNRNFESSWRPLELYKKRPYLHRRKDKKLLDRCYNFQVFCQNNRQKWRFLLKLHTASFCTNLILTLVFEKKRPFFAENHTKLWSKHRPPVTDEA
jgi:hypothetical protein